jgi:type II secretory pathway component PulK
MMQRYQPQSGMAIMLVLYIMVIVSFVTAGAYLLFRYSINSTESFVRTAQLDATADGVERLAQELLAKDIPALDHREEKWAEPKEFIFDAGTASLVITDAQAKFNLNNLFFDDAAPEFLEAYMKAVEAPISSIAAVQDWMDADEEVRPNGAESAYYLLQDTPHHAGNHPFVTLSELFAIKDIDPLLFERYAQYLTVLPEATAINVNGIPDDKRTVMMQSFAKGNRGILSEPVINDTELQQLLGAANPAFTVKSQYFNATIRCSLGEYTLTREILLFRPEKVSAIFDIKVLSRHNIIRITKQDYEQESQ